MALRSVPLLCLLLLVLLLLGLMAPGAQAEDEPPGASAAEDEATQKAKAYARDQLLQSARRVIQPGKLGETQLKPLKQALHDDIVWFTSYVPGNDEERKLLERYEKTIEGRLLLLGEPSEPGEEGTGTQGALQEADLLYLWLLGAYPCAIQIFDRRGEAKSGEARFYTFPPPEPQPAPEATAAEAPAGAGEAPGEKPPSEGASPKSPENGSNGQDAPSKEAGEKNGQGKAGSGGQEETKPPPNAPTPPPKEQDQWALWVVNEKEGGTLVQKIVETSQCSTVTELARAESLAPVVDVDLVGDLKLKRHALAVASPFVYNQPFTELRVIQSGQRVDAYRNEKPPAGLVDESMVHDKAKRAEHFRVQAKRWKEERANLLVLVDQLVVDIDGWRMEAAILSGFIEEEKRRVAAEAPDEGGGAEGEAPRTDEPSLRLMLLAASESLVTLELRLFYHTVLRAQLRVKLIDQLIVLADNEAAAADTARERFGTALAVLRNSRQLDRLKSEAFQLKGWMRYEEGQQPASGEAGRLRIKALQAVLQVNEGVQKLVERRRRLSESVSRSAERATPDAAPITVESAARVEGGGAVEEKARRSVTKLNAQMLDPASSTWDLEWIQLATQQVQDPEVASEFDARLVAQHHAAATRTIQFLELALSGAGDAEAAAELEASLAQAKRALEPLAERRDSLALTSPTGYQLPRMVQGLQRDITDAKASIEAQREEQRRRLEAARDYRRLLFGQGPRSLAIREGSRVKTEELLEAVGEAADAGKSALRWMKLDGEPNLRTFLKAHWWAVLLLVLLALGLARFVQVARRRLDRHLGEMAAGVPELRWTGASVKEERDFAKARKQAEDDALQAAREEVLRQASGDQVEETDETAEEPGESVEAETTRVQAEAEAPAGARPPERPATPSEKPPQSPPAASAPPVREPPAKGPGTPGAPSPGGGS